jgi:hypothetical protein
LDPRRIGIELEKADALRELRPYLAKAEESRWFGLRPGIDRGTLERAVRGFLARIVRAHLLFLIDSPVLLPNVDIEAFGDSAIEDAKVVANDPTVSKIADEKREYLVDICRVTYLDEIKRRVGAWEACPTYSTLHYDPKQEEQISAEMAAKWAELQARAATELAGDEAAPNPNVMGAAEMRWEDIEIRFLSDHRIQVIAKDKIETFNYGDMGFEDARNRKPNRAWLLLRSLAELQGTISDGAQAEQDWPKVEKRIQEIRQIFRSRFGISDDPLPFIEGTGYKARFSIGCAPSYYT